MNVYLIETTIDYEPGDIVGVYSTLHRAEKAFAEKQKENCFDCLYLWRWQVDSNKREVVRKAVRR